MGNKSKHSVLKIFASSTDKVGRKLLYEYIVELAQEKGLAGATVYRGVMGYGLSSKKIHSSRFWELTEKLPVKVEIMDETRLLEDFYTEIESDLNEMKKGCVVSIEPVEIMLIKSGKKAK